MLRKKQIASYIDANFGKSPLDGGMYYDGTGRMKLIREYHEMRECESEVDAITWEDLEMDRIFLSVNHTNCFAGEQVLLAICLFGTIVRQVHVYESSGDQRDRIVGIAGISA